MKYALVEFLSERDKPNTSQKLYTYINEVKAKEYDTVIVPTKYGLALAVVKKLSDNVPSSNYDYLGSMNVIKKVAEVIKSTAVDEVTKEAKRKDIEKQLEKKVKEMDKVQRFELYADQDPEFAKLLKQFKEL